MKLLIMQHSEQLTVASFPSDSDILLGTLISDALDLLSSSFRIRSKVSNP
jgi:hypothetical protein